MFSRLFPARRVALLAFLALLTTPDRLWSQEGEFEPVPTLSASAILPPEQVSGARYRIVEEVANDGYMNSYKIESDFGRFEAYGTAMLAYRLQEVAALAELDELAKSQVFIDAVSRAAMGQVTAVKEFAERPVETVKGVPDGVKRMFKRTKRAVNEGVDKAQEMRDERHQGEEGEEGEEKSTGEKTGELAQEGVEAGEHYAKKYFGVSRAERLWAEKLGVDPYTSNEILMREIKKVAKVDAAGGFAVKLAPIPGIPGVEYIHDMTKLVWSVDPHELRERNMQTLAAAGAEPELVATLFENPWYSPSLQTFLVAAIAELEGVEGRVTVVELAAGVESEDEAWFFVRAMQMLSAFHRSSAPVERLLGGARLPVALTGDGRIVVQAPIDHVSWTAVVAAAVVEGPFKKVAADAGVSNIEFWLRGTVSERCRRELAARGWAVRDRVAFASERKGDG